MTILYKIFLKENPDLTLSYSHFAKLCGEITSVRTVRTGGAEVSLHKLGKVLVERAFRSITMDNTISIDEKHIVIKNYMVRSV